MVEENIAKHLLVSKTGEEGQVDIHGFPWFTPALESQATYKAKLPALRLAHGLKISGCLNDIIHVLLPF